MLHPSIPPQNESTFCNWGRPQFVKAVAVSGALRRQRGGRIFVHTGQHFDENMSRVFFDEMGIPEPSENLSISGGGHGSMTGKMLISIEELIIQQEPDCVLVYGDTNSTLAGALAASKLNVPCAHVEAGLRWTTGRCPRRSTAFLPIMPATCCSLPRMTP